MHTTFAKSALALAFLGLANAHTTFTTLFVDGQNQGDGTCIRMDMNGETCNSPIKGIQSPEMACGRNGEKGVARVCGAKGGSTLTFEYREWVDGSVPGAMDPQHSGPCAVYLKKVDSAIADNNAAGDGWFKIWHEGFDEAAGKWCTNKMIDNNGHLSVKLPADIEGGYYLLRPELLALHAAQDSPPDPQFYSNCAQLYVESSGTAKPPTVAIPGHVDMSMPGLTFNIYAKPLKLPYPLFGPAPYGSSGNAASPANPATPATPATSKTPANSGTPANSAAPANSATPATSAKSGVQPAESTASASAAPSSDYGDSKATADDIKTGTETEGETEEEEEDEDEDEGEDEGDEEDDDEDDENEDDDEDDDECEADDAPDAEDAADGKNGTGKAVTPTSTSSKAALAPRATAAPSGQKEGLKPANCVMENANWCGIEVPSYSSGNGCWTSSSNCWEQSKVCFDQAPPTGAKNCDLWNDKCNHLDDTCNAGQSTGPPDAGKDLTPAKPGLAASKARKLMALVKKHETHVMRRAYRAISE